MIWVRRHLTLRPVTAAVTVVLLIVPTIAKAVS